MKNILRTKINTILGIKTSKMDAQIESMSLTKLQHLVITYERLNASLKFK